MSVTPRHFQSQEVHGERFPNGTNQRYHGQKIKHVFTGENKICIYRDRVYLMAEQIKVSI